MRRSTAKGLILLSTLVVIAVVIIAALNQEKTIMTVTAIAGATLNLILGYFTRCPHCGRWPRRGEFFAQYCSRCGEPLDD